MSTSLKYETPENIQLQYEVAGLGTRFVAWFIDSLLLHLFMFLAMIALIAMAAASEVVRDFFGSFFKSVNPEVLEPETYVTYFIGIMMLIWGLSSFFYYGLSELLMRGQTIGKRLCKVRVVKVEGFSLDAPSVFIRNIFRVADHLPMFWLVPFFSSRSQRLGDMAAGTIVVSDAPRDLPTARGRLADRTVNDARFRFDHVKLGRLKPGDAATVEQLVSRWTKLSSSQRQDIGNRLLPALCKRMQVDEPPQEDRLAFLEDLLSAEYRRQERRLH